MAFRLSLLFLLVVKCYLFAEPGYILSKNMAKAGLFAMFCPVVGFLDQMERSRTKNFIVDFENNGLLYDEDKGDNWWSYYFEPIACNPSTKVQWKYFSEIDTVRLSMKASSHIPHTRAQELLKKYVKVKPEIQEALDSYNETFSSHYVIGVHYRGTDKVENSSYSICPAEAYRVSYDIVWNSIENELLSALNNNKNPIVFVATDEAAFIDFMQGQLDEQLIYQPMTRSPGQRPLHTGLLTPYEAGRTALIDCLLLAKADVLIRTASNLSLASIWFKEAKFDRLIALSYAHHR